MPNFLSRSLLAALLGALSSSSVVAAPIQVHGHRGARWARPENTIPAFEYAIAQSVDALELDVAVTKDNVLVVSHDPVLHPPVCNGPQPSAVIHTLTLEQVRQWDCGGKVNPAFPEQKAFPGTKMPTLDEVFDLAGRGSFLFNVETKISPAHPELTPSPDVFAKMLLDAIQRHHLESRVVVQSFDYRTLHAMKKLDPKIKLSALYAGPSKSFVELAKSAGAQIISPVYPLVTADQVAAAHQAGLFVLPWTPNKPEEWKTLIDAKVDGIITDNPAALIQFLKTQPK